MKKNGFTLIEFLIIIAVVGILSAISIPQYINSQVRSKVAKVKAEQKIIGIGLEAYAVDWDVYPADTLAGWPFYISNNITTPIPYITEDIQFDPFPSSGWSTHSVVQRYRFKNLGYNTYSHNWEPTKPANFSDREFLGKWVIYSEGPWGKLAIPNGFSDGAVEGDWLWLPYNPTNGTISHGNIIASQAKAEVDFSSETRTYTMK